MSRNGNKVSVTLTDGDWALVLDALAARQTTHTISLDYAHKHKQWDRESACIARIDQIKRVRAGIATQRSE